MSAVNPAVDTVPAQPVTFWVCNLAGQPNATVTYTFTYA